MWIISICASLLLVLSVPPSWITNNQGLSESFVRRGRQRSSRPEVFCRKGVLRNFAKFTGKHMCQSLFFNKVERLRPATLLKKRLLHRCFPVNFEKFFIAFWQGPKYTFNISHEKKFSMQKQYSHHFSTFYLLLRLWNCTYFNIPIFHCLKDFLVSSIVWSMDYPHNYLYTFVVSELNWIALRHLSFEPNLLTLYLIFTKYYF